MCATAAVPEGYGWIVLVGNAGDSVDPVQQVADVLFVKAESRHRLVKGEDVSCRQRARGE